MMEAGQREFHGASCAADGGFSFEDFDVKAGLGEHDGGGEAVGTRADDTGLAVAMIGGGPRHCFQF